MKISNDVLAVLSASETDGYQLKLPGELERPLYEKVAKVLKACGASWSRNAKAHIFTEGAAEAIEQALLTGEFQNVKQELGQFDSPEAVVAEIMKRAEIKKGMRVLEPSAGIGNIVSGVLEAGAGYVRANERDKNRLRFLLDRFPAALADGRLYTGDRDFLEVTNPIPDRLFDRICMNPPFAKQADIAHVTHALRFLKPGGRLVSVMSAGITFRSDRNTAEFRRLLDGDGLKAAIHILPDDAFKAAGTAVKTVLVTVDA